MTEKLDAPKVEPPAQKLRYSFISATTLDEARKRIPLSLSKLGDCRLVWVNEGDLTMLGEEMR
jgi:hypothetical protein